MLEDSRKNLEKVIFDKYVNNIKVLRNDLLHFIEVLGNKINRDRIVCILNEEISIEFISDYELYWLAKELGKKYNDEKLELNNYFTETEIANNEKYMPVQDVESNERQLVFRNVMMTELNRCWVAPIVKPEEIKKMSDNTLVTYNKKTQRPMVMHRTPYGDIKQKVSLNKKSVEEIKKSMLEGTFEANSYTFNILQTQNEHWKFEVRVFNEEKGVYEIKEYPDVEDIGDLTIYIDHINGKEVNLIDGFHRYTAELDVISICERQNIPFNLNMSARIFCMTEAEARAYIAQENKQNKFTEEEKSYYDANDRYTIMVDSLNTKGSPARNLMLNKVGINKDQVFNSGLFTTYEILTQSIKREFDIDKDDTSKRIKTTKYLEQGLSNIVGILSSDLRGEAIIKDRENSLKFEPEMFNCYIHLLRKVQGNLDWENIIIDVLSNIDFDKINGTFKHIRIVNSKSTKYKKEMIQKLNNIFDEKLNEVLEEYEGVVI